MRKNKGPNPDLVNQVAQGCHNKVAFVDPNDPSTFYVDQPPVQTNF